MAYDLHIVLTDDWTDAAEQPITRERVDALIAADPELAWSTEDFVDMADAPGGEVTRYFAILWRGAPAFLWMAGEITCSSPNAAQVEKMVELASALGAHVMGDDGEVYEPDTWRELISG